MTAVTSSGRRGSPQRTRPGIGDSLRFALQALSTWTRRQVVFSVLAAVAMGLLVGLATVLIPNPVFGREIPPVWWNYPVWLVTSALSGMLVGTYVRPYGDNTSDTIDAPGPANDDSAQRRPETDLQTGGGEVEEKRTSRMGVAGGVLAWFAVGCPVCNKLALLALGYSGAITWFSPMQPFLAVASLVLIAVALVIRLRGQVYCPLPAPAKAAA